MVKKCPKNKVMRNGKCVLRKSNDKLFSPATGHRKAFMWTSIIALIVSALLGAGFFLFGELNETLLKIVLTTVTVAVASIGLLIVSKFKDKVILTTSMLSVSLSSLLWILFIWDVFKGSGYFDPIFEVLTTTIVLLGGTTIAMLSYSNKFDVVKIVGVLTTAIASLLWLGIIWNIFESSTGFLKTIWIVSIIAFTLAHYTLISFGKNRDGLVASFYWMTILFIAVVSGMLIYLVLQIDNIELTETFFRWLGFFSVLNVAGSIVTPILRRVRG